MTAKERIELCILIEKIKENKECSKRLGLVNKSILIVKDKQKKDEAYDK